MTTIANRPLVTAKAQAPVARPAAPAPAPAQTKPAFTNSMPVVAQPAGMVWPTFTKVVQFVGQAGGRFTPPVIVDIFKSSVKSGFGLQNILWTAVPSAFRNVRDAMNGKESYGRAAANVTTETGFGIAKGIVSGVVVQAASIAAGPLLGLLPANPMVMMGASLAISLGGLMGSYWVMNKVIKKTGVDKAVADKLTNVFGGDKAPAAAPAAAPTPAKA